MVDRQDIDALLIGSLYGELSSAEEARLSAHLESHPSDRTALANLTRAREIVHESRLLQVQFDPPQSVSALLMQEAARRAPKARPEREGGEGWFQRFMRSFLAHPAMAAAVMLVLVIGVAGTVYMKKGDNFAKATQDEAVPSLAQPPAEMSGTDRTATLDPAAPADDYKVKLDDGAESDSQKLPTKQSENKAASDRLAIEQQRERLAAEEGRASDTTRRNAGGKSDAVGYQSTDDGARLATKESTADLDARDRSKAEPAKPTKPVTVPGPAPAKNAPAKSGEIDAPTEIAKTAAPKKAPPRLDVTTPTQVPKDFASSGDDVSGTIASNTRQPSPSGGGGTAASRGSNPGTGPGTSQGAGPKGNTVAPTTPAPAPPPPPPSTIATDEREKQKAATELAWAKERHGKAIAAVNAGKCDVAAGYVIEIANRTPSYYQSTVADDRGLKNCAAYITAQREREAERAQRAKATQRRAADEAPAPAQSTK